MGQRRRGNKGEGFAEVKLKWIAVTISPSLGEIVGVSRMPPSKPDGVTQPVIDGGMDIAGMHRIADP
jgi:hypothetical protein